MPPVTVSLVLLDGLDPVRRILHSDGQPAANIGCQQARVSTQSCRTVPGPQQHTEGDTSFSSPVGDQLLTEGVAGERNTVTLAHRDTQQQHQQKQRKEVVKQEMAASRSSADSLTLSLAKMTNWPLSHGGLSTTSSRLQTNETGRGKHLHKDMWPMFSHTQRSTSTLPDHQHLLPQ